MYLELLQSLDLAQNEARIYEALLREGKSSVSQISISAQVHRRNVYDSLNRLLEKGLVFEIRLANENQYQAVDPRKLKSILDEKGQSLEDALPELSRLYLSHPEKEAVFIYKGIEGWKNYMHDVLRLEEDFYVLGAKSQINDPRLKGATEQFVKGIKEKGITAHRLYDHELKAAGFKPLISTLGDQYRFLPKGFSTTCTVSTFSNRTVYFSNTDTAKIDESASLTVVVNEQLAEANRTWFKLIWQSVAGKS